MRFKIVGADAESGDDVDVILEASSQPEVEKLAHDKGILVSVIAPVGPVGGSTGYAPNHGPGPAPNSAHAPSYGHLSDPAPGHADGHGTDHAPAPAHGRSKELETISLVDEEPGAAGAAHGVITVSASSPSGAGHSGEGHIVEDKRGEAAMEYHIMLNQSLYLLEAAVNKQIRDGWEPQGGVNVAVSNNALQYFQALVKKKKPAEPPHIG